MKTIINYSKRTQRFRASMLFLLGTLFLIFLGCQKSDSQSESQMIIETQFSSLPINLSSESQYLLTLQSTIEKMVTDGLLIKGNANALITKIRSAITSIQNGKPEVARNQLNALIQNIESYVIDGIITVELAQPLLNTTNIGISVLSNGGFIDPRDGNLYPIALIGDQVWMAKNLAYLPLVSKVMDESFDSPTYYVYGYDGTSVSEAKATSNYKTYGALYNWPAASNACPTGWHLPNNDEWKKLGKYVNGGLDGYIKSGYGYGFDIATHLKSTTGWIINGTDDYGFSALPGGMRYYDGFYGGLSVFSIFCSATPWNESTSSGWGLFNNIEYFYNSPSPYDGAFSIRCIKD